VVYPRRAAPGAVDVADEAPVGARAHGWRFGQIVRTVALSLVLILLVGGWIGASFATGGIRAMEPIRSVRRANGLIGTWLSARAAPMEPCPTEPPANPPTQSPPAKRRASRAGTSIFSWTDDEGVVHVVDDVKRVPSRFRAQADAMSSLPPVGAYGGTFSKIGELAVGVDAAPHVTTSTGRAQAIVYSASWCQACKATKAFLRSRGIQVEERDIEKDKTALSELIALAGEDAAIPVTVIGDAVIGGFDENALRAAAAKSMR
jgi:glutaredoxin